MSGRQPGIRWPEEPRALIVTGMADAEIVACYERGLDRDRLASGGLFPIFMIGII
jgi:hypothetical protein